MNEQDLILKQKIEKREKIDTILAYILIVILLGAIILVLYLKFIRKEETILEPEEYVPTYISLNELSTSLNSSVLANRYLNDQVSFTSTASANSMQIIYSKENENINLNIPQVGNELEIKITEENSEITKDIYKEIANIVCVYYGNTTSNCRNITDNINENSQIEGIRFVNKEDNSYVYISIDKSIDVNNKITYNTVTNTDINKTDYILNLNGIKIYDISKTQENNKITFSGIVEQENNENISVVIKLYDETGEIINENKYSYNEELPLEQKNTFNISFVLDEEQIKNISTYTIEIEK